MSTLGHIATDPLRNFRFRVKFTIPALPQFAQAYGAMGFMSVSGLNVSTDVIPYREGGMNVVTQKMPGQSDFSPISMSKGLIIGNSSFMSWMNLLFRVQQGTADIPLGVDFRANMMIEVLDHPRANAASNPNAAQTVRAQFKVYNAWPTGVSFSDLDAGANAIIVTQATFAHEGFDFALASSVTNGGLPNPSWN